MVHPKVVDEPLAKLVAKIPPYFGGFMKNVSVIFGTPYVVLVLASMLIFSLIDGNGDLLKITLFTILLAPLAELSKYITKRQRPETIYAKNMKLKTYSFPSGHSYASALMAGFVSVLVMSAIGGIAGIIITKIVILISFCVGVSRVYLGAHFPTDVLAGWLLGIVMSAVIYNQWQSLT